MKTQPNRWESESGRKVKSIFIAQFGWAFFGTSSVSMSPVTRSNSDLLSSTFLQIANQTIVRS
jgi:hypothetical protein